LFRKKRKTSLIDRKVGQDKTKRSIDPGQVS
jgi:hypothetical protein